MTNKSGVILLLTLVIAGISSAYFWHEDPAIPPKLLGNSPAPLPTTFVGQDRSVWHLAAQDIDYDAMYAGNKGNNPMIDHTVREHFGAAAMAEYDDLHVIPYNPYVRTDCVPDSGSFMGVDYQTEGCTTIRERPSIHPYYDWPLEELAEFALHDAEGSVIMIRRSKTADKLGWAKNAAKLSGKSGPLILAGEWFFPMSTPTVKLLTVRVELETLAKEMGDPRARPEEWANRLAVLQGVADNG